MIEIVFQNSAAISLGNAQTYGKGPYQSGVIAYMYHREDGGEVSEEEIARMQKEWEKEEQERWERAVPLGGKKEDVFAFPLDFDIGDIQKDGIDDARFRELQKQSRFLCGREPLSTAEQIFENARKNLEVIQKRMAKGEAARIWYSDAPEEMCGFMWFLAQVFSWGFPTKVFGVKLPLWVWEDGKEEVTAYSGWKEVSAGEWHQYLHLQKELPGTVVAYGAGRWKELQAENAPLRVVLNGRVQSTAEDFYDVFIKKEIAAQEEVFGEGTLAAAVLQKICGVKMDWIARRITDMIQKGELEALPAAKEEWSYDRLLKRKNF
ncbi:DUF1835 domain-containing protein [Anaerotignum lactatifermentans]|uniref:DUF1835 domain-containing protein n=1 Tax=Anaerotignum lactatifermentans TaxID=160404 RepID=A0ABS2G9G9_9FIRM|nr:DUF3658 domain-containing protein [Anaerotignum lactatifermentans]MBM6829600.1 DUF1835 domain-containing protein [Anaerotignum lactatifermentans]MBM6878094.1 DUF1835 domain-containing protein [Anaerotignum lactatifermentans]MBM6951076.1 DUF1835 domain-containing protein [Anaerotignum lactatifermentans]